MTQGHATDVPILKEAYRLFNNFSLIGVIGSDVKAIKIKKELIDLDFDKNYVAQMACPLGLPIGDNTPPEIAISICSQLLAKRDQKNFSVLEGAIRYNHL